METSIKTPFYNSSWGSGEGDSDVQLGIPESGREFARNMERGGGGPIAPRKTFGLREGRSSVTSGNDRSLAADAREKTGLLGDVIRTRSHKQDSNHDQERNNRSKVGPAAVSGRGGTE